MSDDFPAAHSMDTTWFAVDRDGNVARFDSGEPGVVPEEAATDEADDVSTHVKALLRGGRAPSAIVEELEALATRHRTAHAYFEEPQSAGEALVFTGEPLEGARNVEATETAAQVVPAAKARELVTALHARDACRGCFPFERGHDDATAEDDYDFAWPITGVYAYGDDGDFNSGTPYARTARPATPLKVEELPKEIADKVAVVRFPIAFAETPRFQPMDYVTCAVWGAAWETVDGELRPVPGMEREFEKDYAEHVQEQVATASTYRTTAGGSTGHASGGSASRVWIFVALAIAVSIGLAVLRGLGR